MRICLVHDAIWRSTWFWIYDELYHVILILRDFFVQQICFGSLFFWKIKSKKVHRGSKTPKKVREFSFNLDLSSKKKFYLADKKFLFLKKVCIF